MTFVDGFVTLNYDASLEGSSRFLFQLSSALLVSDWNRNPCFSPAKCAPDIDTVEFTDTKLQDS